MSLRCGLSFYKLMVLTRLSRLNRTSLLPSSCNLDKNFALTGHLAQVHMANKKFPIFLHAGRGNGKGQKSHQLSINFIIRCFCSVEAIASIAQSAERVTSNQKIRGTKPGVGKNFFYVFFFRCKYVCWDKVKIL